jgi:hypothetical protein
METTWVQKLHDSQKYYKDILAELESLLEACYKLDLVGIPAEGSLYRNTITIRKATEDYIPKLVRIKTEPVVKYFHNWSGELGYSTKIGDVDVFVVPDIEKYVCKVRKEETSKFVKQEEKTTKFYLDGDCDPLFFEEATREEVV